MSALDYIEVPTGELDYSDKGVKKTTRRWLVHTDQGDTEEVALAAIPVHRFDAHPVDSSMRALDAKAVRTGEWNKGQFWVTVDYTSEQKKEDPQKNDSTVPPDERPYLVTMHAVKHETVLGPYDKDYVNFPVALGPPVVGPGKLVANTAGQMFSEPPLMCPSSNILISIKGFFAFAAVAPTITMSFFLDTVNLLPYTIPGGVGPALPARSLRCNDYSFEKVFEQDEYWWSFCLQVEYKRDLWNPVRVANLGTHLRATGNSPLVPIMVRGRATTRPIPINELGNAPLNAGDPIFLCEFKAYEEKSWAGII